MKTPVWTRHKDELVGFVWVLEGYELYGDSGFCCRIFTERRTTMKGFSEKEYRYFPQINIDSDDRLIIIGDPVEGIKSLAVAKKYLLEEIQKLDPCQQ